MSLYANVQVILSDLNEWVFFVSVCCWYPSTIIIEISLQEDLYKITPIQVLNSRMRYNMALYRRKCFDAKKFKRYQTFYVMQTCLTQIHVAMDSRWSSQSFLITKKLTFIDVNQTSCIIIKKLLQVQKNT